MTKTAERLESFGRQMASTARGELLRQARESYGLSQEDAAHRIGVTAKTLRAWEHGGVIRGKNLVKVSRFYKINRNDLLIHDELGERIVHLEAMVEAIAERVGVED